MRRTAILGVLLGFVMTLSMGVIWDATWEAKPIGTEPASDLDLFIREFKEELANRTQVETIFGIGTNDNGLARLGSARAFMSSGAPTDLTGLGAYNSAAGTFAGTVLSTNEPGGSIDQGTGRFWVDTDNMQLRVWVDSPTSAFVPVTATPAVERPIGNLIYNGSFEITDGTGLIASTTVPSGWIVDGTTPTIAYDNIANSTEGDGIAVETIGSGAANEHIMQRLAGLKESTVYVYRARVRPVVGTCQLFVDDGTTTANDVSAAASGVFETLEVSHTTTAGPADVDVELRSVADTNECDWDHVTVFERNALVAQPGIQAIFTEDNTEDATIDAVFGNNPFLTTSITIPGPGQMVVVDASVSAQDTSGTATGFVRLARDDCAGGAFTQQGPIKGVGGGSAVVAETVDLNFVDIPSPANAMVPGATCIYRVEVLESAGTIEVNNLLAQQQGSSLRLLLMPAR